MRGAESMSGTMPMPGGVWAAFGAVAYALGITITGAVMRSVSLSRTIPIATGLALAAAGLFQVTSWKRSCLSHCRSTLMAAVAPVIYLEKCWKYGETLATSVGIAAIV